MPTIHINYEIGAPTSWVHYNRTYVPKAAHPRPMLLPWMRKTRGRQGVMPITLLSAATNRIVVATGIATKASDQMRL